jgi:uncharacterized protein (TIGR02246 family)
MRPATLLLRLPAFAGAILFAAGLATAQDADLAAQVEAVQERYSAAWTAGDADALAEMHTDDAVMWPAIGGMHEGREAIRTFFQEGPQPESFELRSDRAERIGDLVLNVGTFSAAMPAEYGGPIEGKFLVIAREADGELLLHRVFAAPARDRPPPQ